MMIFENPEAILVFRRNAQRQIVEAARGLADYRSRVGATTFQLEKADDYIDLICWGLSELDEADEKLKDYVITESAEYVE